MMNLKAYIPTAQFKVCEKCGMKVLGTDSIILILNYYAHMKGHIEKNKVAA